MNTSLAIVFDPAGRVALLLGETVSGFQAVVQNALVNLLTQEGNDPLYPRRGTSLYQTGLEGGIYSPRSAAHASNFAASDTLFFSREQELAATSDQLAEVLIRPVLLGISNLDVLASFTSLDGRQLSNQLPVTA